MIIDDLGSPLVLLQFSSNVRAQFKDPRLRVNVHWKDVNGARDMEAGPGFLMKSPTIPNLYHTSTIFLSYAFLSI